MKAQFANTLADLIEGAFAPSNVIRVLDDLIAKIGKEHEYAMDMNMFLPDNPWWPSIEYAKESRDAIRKYARERPEAMYRHIQTSLGFEKENRYAVNLTVTGHGEAVMNSRPVTDKATGNYYMETSIKIIARPYPGFMVDFWEVNGVNKGAGKTVTIDGEATVNLQFKRDTNFDHNTGTLRIEAVKARQNDYIEIHNPTRRPLSTEGLHLSDSNSDFFKWKMPTFDVLPGESILIATRDNNEDNPLFVAKTNFNLSNGERLRLTEQSGKVLSLVEIASMERDEIQKRQINGNFSIVKIN
jgi:hypothetical protein